MHISATVDAQHQGLLQELQETRRKLEEKNRQLEILNQIGQTIGSELKLEKLVQKVTDAATKLSKAQFGAFFYNVINQKGEKYVLYTLSGVPREAFAQFPMPRNTKVFAPTFHGEGIVRSGDITKDPRYGQNSPLHGMPAGHLPVKSYLAVPVVSNNGQVLGGLFFGHSKPDVFTENEETVIAGIAAQAAVAIDNARLYESLQQTEQRVSIILETIPHMAWTANPEGKVDYFNHRWQEYTGFTIDNLLQPQSWQAYLHPDDQQATVQKWHHCVKTGEVYEQEGRLLRASDHTWRWHVTRAIPIRNQQQEIILWVGSSTDIDDYKKAQETLLQKNVELVRINEDLDTFVYRASHDLKSPMVNIVQLIEELSQSVEFKAPDAPTLQTYLRKSLNELHTTIDDLSQVVKAQKNINAEPEEIDLQQVLSEVELNLLDLLEKSRARIRTDFKRVSRVTFSRINLKSILLNLVSNSLKYRAPDRQPQIQISSDLSPEHYVLTVEDNGLGFDLEKNRDKLFKMFSRLHDHTPGSGIGLYIVNRLVTNSGGFIEVDSQLGSGTTFRIYLKRPSV